MERLVERETITGNPKGERKSRRTEAPLIGMNYAAGTMSGGKTRFATDAGIRSVRYRECFFFGG